jgi:DNA polymerase III epsilon subunit family exonuclease
LIRIFDWLKRTRKQEQQQQSLSSCERDEVESAVDKLDVGVFSVKVLTGVEAALLRGSQVVIPYGYTKIGRLAFFNRLDIESIIIPEGVIYIDEYAFRECENLVSITIPDSVVSIGEGAFRRCSILRVFCSETSYAYKYFHAYHKQSEIVSLFTKEWFNLACTEFIALDIETTGLNRNYDYIIEVAAIKYQNCVEVDKFVTLINPKVPIPPEATAINGITDEMVKNSSSIETVLPQLLAFLGDKLLVGHYANFDISFIEVWAKQLGYSAKWNYIDTISIAKKLVPNLPNYKLITILNAIGYKQVNYHRAEDDCKGCAEIMKLGIKRLTQIEK